MNHNKKSDFLPYKTLKNDTKKKPSRTWRDPMHSSRYLSRIHCRQLIQGLSAGG
nr:MAG TPA: hypothetical protein [Caudoviricetes sp.]